MKPSTTHILLIGLLFVLSPLHLLDLLPHASTHILGDVMDTAQYLQNEWWTAHALLDLKTNPFRNDHMFHPFGFHMIQHNYNFLDGLLYTLSRPVVPLLVFHNVLTWLSVFLNSLAAYCLILSVTGMASLAFVGAVAFAHSPVLTSYHGAQALLEPYMLVFFVLASLALFKRPTYPRALGTGILLGLSVYTYPYYFVAGLVWLGVILGYRLVPWTLGETEDTGPVRLLQPGIVGAWLLFVPVLAWVLVPRNAWPVSAGASRGIYLVGLLAAALALVGYVAMTWSRAGRGRERARVEWRPPSRQALATDLSVAAALLVTAALGALPFTHAYVTEGTVRSALESRSVDFLLYSVDLAAFFAPFHPWLSGVYQHVAADWTTNRPLVGTPAFLGWLWIGLGVVGFGLYLRKPAMRLWVAGWTVFLFLCLGPYLKIHGSVYPSLVLPGYFVPHLPLLANTRTLSRFVVPLVLLTIVIGCLVLKSICQGSRRGWASVMSLGVLAITTFEFALWPHPHQPRPTDYRVPAVYYALADQAGGRPGVLLDLPLFSHSGIRSEGRGQSRWHYYQAVHQQKLIGGVASKLDDRTFGRFEELPGIPSLWARTPVSPGELEALLAALDVDWIVLNKSQYAPEVLRSYLGTLDRNGRVRRFYEDREYLGLRVERASDPRHLDPARADGTEPSHPVTRFPESMEVNHTPRPFDDIPEYLIERLEEQRFPYVRFYRTDVTNNTQRPIRIVWFESVFESNGSWIASNVRGMVLRTSDFRDWYGGEDMTDDGWIRPGGTASCRANWHWSRTPDERSLKWAYVAVDAAGNDYFAEAVVPKIKPVRLRLSE